MKQRYFYIAVTAVTAVLCLAGCGEDESSITASQSNITPVQKGASPAAGVYNGGDKVVIEKHEPSETVETAVTTLTPFQTFVRMTALFGDRNGDEETNGDDEYEDEENEDRDDHIWFSAHSPFNMAEGEEDSFFKETWYRFNYDDNDTYPTVVTMYEHITTAPGLKDSVKEPEPYNSRKSTAPAEK